MDNPFDPALSVKIAERQIAIHSNRAMIRGAGYAVTLGLFGAIQLAILVVLGRDGFELPLMFAAGGAAFSYVFRRLAKRGALVGGVRYVAMAAWASFPTAFLLTSHFAMPGGAATYINGPMVLIYFPLIFMAAFTFDWRIALFSGLLAAAGYVLAAILALPAIGQLSAPDPITQQDLTDPAVYVIKAFVILFGGMVAAGMTVIARRLVLAGVHRAHERGNYQLVEQLGHGGMGEVWVAEHQMLARPAAVKIIKPQALGSSIDEEQGRTVLQRFEQEAQATALLRSPHTIEIYDFGLADDGTFYYVMELLDGFDFEALIDEHGPQPAERVVHLLLQACQSLAEAHARGLVHRDIKPANIHVCRYGLEVDYVKVLDFGLVKQSGKTEVALTADQVTVGTPAYMPPETALGGELDGRSDLYALGCVGYWLLTGGRVFDGDNPMQVVTQHVSKQPTPPSQATELPVPEALDDVILACLAKQPEDRPATASTLAARLRDLEIEQLWTEERQQRWWELHARAPRTVQQRSAPTERDASERELEAMLDTRRR